MDECGWAKPAWVGLAGTGHGCLPAVRSRGRNANAHLRGRQGAKHATQAGGATYGASLLTPQMVARSARVRIRTQCNLTTGPLRNRARTPSESFRTQARECAGSSAATGLCSCHWFRDWDGPTRERRGGRKGLWLWSVPEFPTFDVCRGSSRMVAWTSPHLSHVAWVVLASRLCAPLVCPYS